MLTLDLRDDPAAIAAYRQYHAQVWPEVERSLTHAGIRQMDIYLLERRLVMILEVEDGLDVGRVFERHAASDPKVVQWERLMKTLQQPAPGAPPGAWWALMEPVYQLSTSSGADAAPVEPAQT